MRTSERGGGGVWAEWLAVTLVAVAWSFGLARHNFALHSFDFAGSWALYDEGAAALPPWLIVRGETPYADFEPRFTPLGWYVFAAGYRVFGVNLLSLRYVLAATTVVTALFTFAWARRAGAGGWAWLAPAVTLMWGAAEYNVATPRWLAIATALGAGLVLSRHAPYWRARDAGWAGVLCGVTFLLTQNTGVFAVTACVFALAVWTCGAASGTGSTAAARWHGLLPVAAAGLAAAVLAWTTWQGRVSPPWLLFAAPGIAVAFACVLLLRGRRLKAFAARHLLVSVGLLGMWTVVVAAAGLGSWIARAGWEPVTRSLTAGAGSLQSIYALEPPAPPRAFAWAVVGGAVGVGALAWPKTGTASMLRYGAVIAAAVCATFFLWTMWLPLAAEGSLVARIVVLCGQFLTISLQHLCWLLAVAGLAVSIWDARRGALSAEQATAFLPACFAATFWLHLHPWSDYTHLIWAMPPMGIVLAVLAHRTAKRARALWGAYPRWRGLRFGLAAAGSLMLGAVLVAMLAKWTTYWLDWDATLVHRRPVRRAFVRLDPARGGILVDAQTAEAWQEMLAHVRNRTPPDARILAIPYLPLAHVLSDRRPAVYDCFWWPDFVGEARARQQGELLTVIQEQRAPLIVGPGSDETYFSLRVLRETWPDVWTELVKRYERTATYGPYWVYEPRTDE